MFRVKKVTLGHKLVRKVSRFKLLMFCYSADRRNLLKLKCNAMVQSPH